MSSRLPTDGTWSFGLATRIVAGPGSVQRVGELAGDHSRVLLVTDPGVARAGHAETVRACLLSAGLEVSCFESVQENPTTVDVEAAREALREARAELVVAVGGGSSIDAAKGAILLAAGGGRIDEYWARHEAPRAPDAPLLPLIAIPTTAGTGSEVQSFALVADPDTHAKMACGHPGLAPRAAILDPSLTATMPQGVAACTGLDALTHAVEAAVSRAASSLSRTCALEAFARLARHLPLVLEGRAGEVEREGMLVGAALAGLAIENGMLGAAHSMANPLTAHHGLAHGQAVAMALPHVIRFNGSAEGTADLYRELAVRGGLAPAGEPAEEAVELLARRVEELLELAGLPTGLCRVGVEVEGIPALAAEAACQWTAGFNPREVGEPDFVELFSKALGTP